MYLVLKLPNSTPGIIVRPCSHFGNFLLWKKLEIDLKQNDDWRAAGGAVTVVTAPVPRPISSFRHFDGRRLSRHFGDLKAGARRRQGL